MGKTRREKQELIENLKKEIKDAKGFGFVGFLGIKVSEMNQIREKFKQNKLFFKVIKKNLLKKAFEDFNIKIGDELLETKKIIGVCISKNDEILPSKSIYEIQKQNENFELLGAILEGKYLQRQSAVLIAKLPSKQELLNRLVYILNSPISNFVSVLQGNIRNLVLVLNNLINNK